MTSDAPQPPQPPQHDLSRDVASALGSMQLELIRAQATIRELQAQLTAERAEADSLRSQVRAIGGAGHEHPAADAATPKPKKGR